MAFPLGLINTAWHHSHVLPGYGSRDPFPISLLSACHPSIHSPPVAPLLYHFKHMLHILAFTVHLHPPLLHLSLSLGLFVLTSNWPPVPVFPRPLLPSSNALSLCSSHAAPHALFDICNVILSSSPKSFLKSNSSSWCLQKPWQLLCWHWSLTLTHFILLLPYIPICLMHFLPFIYIESSLKLIFMLYVQHLAYIYNSVPA